MGKKRIRRLMRLMGLMPIYQKPNTSKPNKAHKIYPYLLGDLNTTKANHVWCYECVYLHAWSGAKEAKAGIGKWITFYNTKRPHKVHKGLTPGRGSLEK